jgi:hypothetical protein
MSNVTLNDVRLGDYNLDNMPLLARLRQDLIRTKPAVCIERARFVTPIASSSSKCSCLRLATLSFI